MLDTFGRIEELSNFGLDLTHNLKEVLGHLDGLLLRIGPKYGKAADDLLGLREGSVSNRRLSIGDADTHAQRTGQATLGGKKPARFHALFDQFSNPTHLVGRGWSIPFNVLVET